MTADLKNQDEQPEKDPLGFDIIETGCMGNFSLFETKDQSVFPSTLPSGLPPVLNDIESELENILLSPENVAIHSIEKCLRFHPRERNPGDLLNASPFSNNASIEMERDPKTGELLGFKEIFRDSHGQTASNSMSLTRVPGDATDLIKGKTTNLPFLPGGLPIIPKHIDHSSTDADLDFNSALLATPPGFKSAVDLPDMKSNDTATDATLVNEKPLQINSLLTLDFDGLDLSDDDDNDDDLHDFQNNTITNSVSSNDKESEQHISTTQTQEYDKIVMQTISSEEASSIIAPLSAKVEEEEPVWAIIHDTSEKVKDFNKQIPDLAHKWPFELDTFQKQAILHLEKHENVFVSAHTSAGKTVVAEYAIALARKHMTKAVYTSPIKALSNQKFRDFKGTFDDVGLITGDVQIRPEAACLIMTTEILRSMLYNGSDVIRDIEWVIFDEVHYINDAERGVVWEEVLILLPKHISIILLSATVPNTFEFADWIGKTKQQKVYVISTNKRPVPLEHFLFTGNSRKTINEMFLLVDSSGKLSTRGYKLAQDSLKQKQTKGKDTGAKGYRPGNQKQDKNIWLTIIERIHSKEQLPAVAFTFSKKKIDDIANNLSSVDLTSSSEKSQIHVFIQSCVSRLKGTDRQLPQITRMRELLSRGLAIHHSGILPILKETVELLFQRGLVKVLFATETFAMGVNMPARTVLFDSIRKHDGQSFRNLLPSEYIQMAGRAGRRGLDTTGTVILLCKGDVPELSELNHMMLGKPTKLESRFRLTYSMILNLLRVEELRVEDMMKRSFAEFYIQKDAPENKRRLEELEKELESIKDTDCNHCVHDIKEYYIAWAELLKLKKTMQISILSSPQTSKTLCAGRVIVIDKDCYQSCIGVIIKHSNMEYFESSDVLENRYCVMVLCETEHENSTDVIDSSTADYSSNSKKLFLPKKPSQILLSVKGAEITSISSLKLTVDSKSIVNDFNKRDLPRFSDAQPAASVLLLTQELLRITETHPNGPNLIDPVRDMHVRNLDFVELVHRNAILQSQLDSYVCQSCPNFPQHFNDIRFQMKLKDDVNQLQHLLSDANLELLPEYKHRISVLKHLRYINDQETVQLKGRVACEISNHELMITELVFENYLTQLQPTEIVALLSCFVFEQKRTSEPNLNEILTQGVKTVTEKAKQLCQLQRDYGIDLSDDDYVGKLKFGLVEVVYHWASGMPFNEITCLTDVSEGIIVRCIQRLNEACRDVRNAAKIIGDPILFDKMEQASSLIKRDIVFAASLYTS